MGHKTCETLNRKEDLHMKNIRMKTPLAMSKEQREVALVQLVDDTINRVYNPNTDSMAEIMSADDLHHITTWDAKTSLGAKVIFYGPHGIKLVHDTYEGIVTASWNELSVSESYDEDPAGFQMATSDLYWVQRS